MKWGSIPFVNFHAYNTIIEPKGASITIGPCQPCQRSIADIQDLFQDSSRPSKFEPQFRKK